MTVLLALASAVLPAAAPPPPYWTRYDQCGHGHRRQVAEHALGRLLRNHRPLTPHRAELAGHLRTCLLERQARRPVQARARALRRWRLSYAHRWPIAFNRLAPWERSWAYSTGACESGNNPATATGNGYYGAFQFLLSTWWAAGGQGIPSQHSWAYQAVIAVRWMHRAGAGQWPICGV